MLEKIVIEPKQEPQASVIWLHGLGADGSDFSGLVQSQPALSALPVRFTFPHAPMQPVTINGGMVMRAWYDIKGMSADSPQDVEGIQAASASIQQLIDQEIERGFSSEQIMLAGFSQGGAIALYTGLCCQQPLGGILALSTYLPVAGVVMQARHSNNQGLEILMCHGQADQVLPIQWAELSRDLLKANGYSVAWRDYAMGHEVNRDNIEDCVRWFTDRLSA